MPMEPVSGDDLFRVVPNEFKDATGTESTNLQLELIDQISNTLWLPSELPERKRAEKVYAALAALKGIEPKDEMEGLLATQMLATHSAAMECLRRAMMSEQPLEGRDLNLKHAAKLLSLYARQMETLDKHRGKGHQKITVERVNVEAGGQAIVGNVEPTSKEAAKVTQPAELEHSNDPVMPPLTGQSAREKSTAHRKEPRRDE